MIAPGMHAEVVVSFQPESLADYSDEVLVGVLVCCCMKEETILSLPTYSKKAEQLGMPLLCGSSPRHTALSERAAGDQQGIRFSPATVVSTTPCACRWRERMALFVCHSRPGGQPQCSACRPTLMWET